MIKVTHDHPTEPLVHGTSNTSHLDQFEKQLQNYLAMIERGSLKSLVFNWADGDSITYEKDHNDD